MSICRCDLCEAFVDTDFEGYDFDRSLCENCSVDEYERERDEFEEFEDYMLSLQEDAWEARLDLMREEG